MLFQGIHHGVLSPYGLPAGSPQHTSGALNRAKEVVAAALYSQHDLITRALAEEEVPLRLVSTSLLTPTSVTGKEKAMLRDQIAAWQTLSDPLKQPLEIRVHDHESNIKPVKVALSLAALNFEINEATLKLGLGTSTSDAYNAPALARLLGNDLRPEAEPGFSVAIRALKATKCLGNSSCLCFNLSLIKTHWAGRSLVQSKRIIPPCKVVKRV